MRPDPDELTYGVTFTESVADQALLGAIERALTTQPYSSFSDLCKQALRQLLLSLEVSPTMSLFLELQRQIVDLRVGMAALEHRVGSGDRPSPASSRVEELERQLAQLTRPAGGMEPARSLNHHLYESLESERVPMAEQRMADPLLNRLVPLLDEF